MKQDDAILGHKGAQPVREHRAWVEGAVNRYLARHDKDYRLDRITDEQCLVVPASNDEVCTLDLGHEGPHSWQP